MIGDSDGEKTKLFVRSDLETMLLRRAVGISIVFSLKDRSPLSSGISEMTLGAFLFWSGDEASNYGVIMICLTIDCYELISTDGCFERWLTVIVSGVVFARSLDA